MTGQAGDAPRRLRVRPSGLKGRCAIAPRRPPAALDPGASADPDRHNKGQARRPAPGGARRSLPDYKITSIRVSTVWGDCHRTRSATAVLESSTQFDALASLRRL